jgi:hypothetical protein
VSDTVFDRIIACLDKASASDPNVHEAPVALLWPDEERRWQPVIDRLADRIPVVSLGTFEPAQRRGPAYWIRCVVAGTVDAHLVDGRPVVYLPGVPQNAVRAAETCTPELAPSPSCSTAADGSPTPRGATGPCGRCCLTPSTAWA